MTFYKRIIDKKIDGLLSSPDSDTMKITELTKVKSRIDEFLSDRGNLHSSEQFETMQNDIKAYTKSEIDLSRFKNTKSEFDQLLQKKLVSSNEISIGDLQLPENSTIEVKNESIFFLGHF